MPVSPSVRSGRSAAVITAFTPRQLLRLRRVDLLDAAHAHAGERSTRPTSWPGMLKHRRHSGRVPSPCRRHRGARGACRRSEFLAGKGGVEMSWSGSSHHGCGVLDGAHDLVIAGAAAKIAGKAEADFLLGRGLGFFAERAFAAIRKPGVQMPHCRAACSRNFAAADAACRHPPCPRWSRRAGPSASAPSTRQEQTSRPSRMMLQAPQSPVPQPSLAPVRPSRLRSTSSSVSSGSQTKLDRVAVDRG